jgi:hypothetical protein
MLLSFAYFSVEVKFKMAILLFLSSIRQDGVFIGRKGHFKLCSLRCIIYVQSKRTFL